VVPDDAESSADVSWTGEYGDDMETDDEGGAVRGGGVLDGEITPRLGESGALDALAVAGARVE